MLDTRIDQYLEHLAFQLHDIVVEGVVPFS